MVKKASANAGYKSAGARRRGAGGAGKAEVFLRVVRPAFVRKELLRSAITSAKVLKEYEEGARLRERKIILLRRLGKVMADAGKVVRKVSREKLPRLPEEARPKPKPKIKIVKPSELKLKLGKTRAVKEKEKRREVTELDKLKGELADIEAKLRGL